VRYELKEVTWNCCSTALFSGVNMNGMPDTFDFQCAVLGTPLLKLACIKVTLHETFHGYTSICHLASVNKPNIYYSVQQLKTGMSGSYGHTNV